MGEAARRLDEALGALSVSRPGAHKREPSPEEAAALRKYWGTGRPIYAMARTFGVAENTLRRWARDLALVSKTCN